MGLILWLGLRLWPNGPALWLGGIGVGLGAAVYLALTALLRMDEVRLVRRVLRVKPG